VFAQKVWSLPKCLAITENSIIKPINRLKLMNLPNTLEYTNLFEVMNAHKPMSIQELVSPVANINL